MSKWCFFDEGVAGWETCCQREFLSTFWWTVGPNKQYPSRGAARTPEPQSREANAISYSYFLSECCHCLGWSWLMMLLNTKGVHLAKHMGVWKKCWSKHSEKPSFKYVTMDGQPIQKLCPRFFFLKARRERKDGLFTDTFWRRVGGSFMGLWLGVWEHSFGHHNLKILSLKLDDDHSFWWIAGGFLWNSDSETCLSDCGRWPFHHAPPIH